MANPVLVEVTRGERVESRHRGAVAIVGCATAKASSLLGDIEEPVFPRSAVKAIQALPLVESGAADASDFAPASWRWRRLRMAGSREHVAGVSAMLDGDRAGRERRSNAVSHAPRMHRPRPRADPPRQEAEPAAQQLLRQARQFPRASAPSRSRPPRLYRRSAPGAGRWSREALAALTGAPHATEACGTTDAPSPPMPCRSRPWRWALRGFGAGIGISRTASRSGAAHLPGGGGRAVLCRRHRADLHRDDDGAEWRRAGEDRRGGRVLRLARASGSASR